MGPLKQNLSDCTSRVPPLASSGILSNVCVHPDFCFLCLICVWSGLLSSLINLNLSPSWRNSSINVRKKINECGAEITKVNSRIKSPFLAFTPPFFLFTFLIKNSVRSNRESSLTRDSGSVSPSPVWLRASEEIHSKYPDQRIPRIAAYDVWATMIICVLPTRYYYPAMNQKRVIICLPTMKDMNSTLLPTNVYNLFPSFSKS